MGFKDTETGVDNRNCVPYMVVVTIHIQGQEVYFSRSTAFDEQIVDVFSGDPCFFQVWRSEEAVFFFPQRTWLHS